VITGLLLDFYGTVVEDDDAIMAAIAGRVAAGASTPVTVREVGAAWGREYEAVAAGPRFRTLRRSALESLATVMAEVGCVPIAFEISDLAGLAPDHPLTTGRFAGLDDALRPPLRDE
jgi:2-haloacid dehalogenase/putative hydrolase of the HAD superfamily